MKVFDYLAERQTLIFNIFSSIKRLLSEEVCTPALSTQLYVLEVRLIDEITKYTNTQLNLFKSLSELGYTDEIKSMFIYRPDVRQLLLLVHEHQDFFQSPDSIIADYTFYKYRVKELFFRLRECIKRDNKNFSTDFQSIIKKIEPFHKNCLSDSAISQ